MLPLARGEVRPARRAGELPWLCAWNRLRRRAASGGGVGRPVVFTIHVVDGAACSLARPRIGWQLADFGPKRIVPGWSTQAGPFIFCAARRASPSRTGTVARRSSGFPQARRCRGTSGPRRSVGCSTISRPGGACPRCTRRRSAGTGMVCFSPDEAGQGSRRWRWLASAPASTM